MGLYPEKVIASVCSPIDGLCTKIEYLPSLAKLKSSLEEAASEISERERLASQPRPQPAPRQKPDKSYLYTGPIEKIKPGDILAGSRLEEYNNFIRSKGIVPKSWGRFETWRDNGARPFDNNNLSVKPQSIIGPEENNNSNPFDP